MVAIGKLYGPAQWHPLAQGVIATANAAGLELESPPFEHFKDNHAPEYRAKFPMAKIPAFEGADGFLLTETTAIRRYVAAQNPAGGLLGTDARSAALVDQWVSLVEKEVHWPTTVVNQICRGISNLKPYNKGMHTFYAAKQADALALLEAHLAKNTFLVGERITVADIVLVQALAFAVQVTLGAEERGRYPAVMRHFETVFYAPVLKGAFGAEPKYAEKPLTYQPPAKDKKE